MNTKTKPLPSLRSDAQAEAFVASADLTEYDLSGFRPMRFEIAKKKPRWTMRLPAALLDAVRAKARAAGIPYCAVCAHGAGSRHRPNARTGRPARRVFFFLC